MPDVTGTLLVGNSSLGGSVNMITGQRLGVKCIICIYFLSMGLLLGIVVELSRARVSCCCPPGCADAYSRLMPPQYTEYLLGSCMTYYSSTRYKTDIFTKHQVGSLLYSISCSARRRKIHIGAHHDGMLEVGLASKLMDMMGLTTTYLADRRSTNKNMNYCK